MNSDDTGPLKLSSVRLTGSTLFRRIVLILLLTVGAYLLLPCLAGIGNALQLVRQANGSYLVAAIAFQASSVLSHAYVVRKALLAFGPRTGFWHVLQIALAGAFATLLIPSAGLSGLALRARYLTENGYTVEASLCSFVLESVGLGIALSTLAAAAFLRLTLTGQQAPWWALALLLSTVLLGGALLAILAYAPRSGDPLSRWLHTLLGPVNRIRARWGRPTLAASALEQRLDHLRQAVLALNAPARFRLLLASLARALGEVLCLHMTLMAFGQVVPLHVTVISHALSAALGWLSSSPGGLLVTESSLPALMASRGVPISAAIAAALVFRLIAFWLPRALGLGTWYNLQRHTSRSLW